MENLGICDDLIKKTAEKNILEPTAVQKAVIPSILSGKDCFFESETGTGKTFAYLLPLVQRIRNEQVADKTKIFALQLIIAAPTHELASQIKTEFTAIDAGKAVLCFGGSPIKRQLEALKEKPLTALGSPLRILELIRLKKIKTAGISALVLDEADRLLSSELRDHTMALVDAIFEDTSRRVQLIACSATLPPSLQKLLSAKLKNPPEIFMLPPEDVLRKRISHWAFFAEKRDKIDLLRSFLAAEKPAKAMVFCARSDDTVLIAQRLAYKKVDCAALSGLSEKTSRKQTIDRFRSGKCPILITSDLGARGLDIPGVTHIIQMDIPENQDFFIHRAGRTGRAGHSGINILIGDEWELNQLAKLEKKLKIIVHPKALRSGKIIRP